MCDTLVALGSATVDGSTLFAKNSDRPPHEAAIVEWSPRRRDGRELATTHITIESHPIDTLGCLIVRPEWCWGAEHGVNEAGVAIGNEAVYTSLDPRSAPPALIGMDLVRLGLERGRSAAGAVSEVITAIERYGQGGACHDPASTSARAYWSSLLVADPYEVYVIETSGPHVAVERVDRVRAISNRTTIEWFDAEHRHVRQPVEQLVDPRWHASNRLLAHQPVSVDRLQQHLRSHDSCLVDGWSVCMHGRDDAGRLVEATTSSIIVELSEARAPTAFVLVGQPCSQSYRRVVVEGAFIEASSRRPWLGSEVPRPGWPSSA